MRRSIHLVLGMACHAMAMPLAMAQEMSLFNGTMTIEAGTRIAFPEPLTWTIGPGATVVNDGVVDLGLATLIEQENAPVTGTGTETAIHVHPGGPFSAEPGGLGLAVNGDAPEDTLLVTRGHGVTTVNGSISSVARWYRFSTSSSMPLDVNATLFVDPSERNGIAADALQLHRATGLAGPWTPLSGTNDPSASTVSGSFIAADVHLTAFAEDVLTNVPDVEVGSAFRLWPSVSSDLVNVGMPSGATLRDIEVFAINGARMPVLILTRQADGLSLDVSSYAAGVYVVRVNGRHDQRFVRP